MLAVACALASTVAFAGGFREDPAKYWNFGELARTPDYRANPFPGSDCPGLKAMLVKGKGLPNESGEFFVYFATPEGNIPEGLKIVDLSRAFRVHDDAAVHGRRYVRVLSAE